MIIFYKVWFEHPPIFTSSLNGAVKNYDGSEGDGQDYASLVDAANVVLGYQSSKMFKNWVFRIDKIIVETAE